MFGVLHNGPFKDPRAKVPAITTYRCFYGYVGICFWISNSQYLNRVDSNAANFSQLFYVRLSQKFMVTSVNYIILNYKSSLYSLANSL